MLRGKTVFISGGSRGIGLAIALRLAKEGANIAIAAKTATPHPKLPGTIYTAAEAVKKAGGKALPLVVDIRDQEQIEKAISKTVEEFGGIDILVNNASAISLTKTVDTSVKTYDLMHSINSRGTWLVTKLAIPHLLNSAAKNRNPHILTLSPPLHNNILTRHFEDNTAYAMAKYGMSLANLGHAGELRGQVGVNALWPYTTIDTEAIRFIASQEARSVSRSPEIMADAAVLMLSKPASEYTGNFEIDELFLRKEAGYNTKQLSQYADVKDEDLGVDFFLPEWVDQEINDLRAKDTSLVKSKM